MVPFRNITLEFCLVVRLNPAWSLIDTCLSESPVSIWELQRVCIDETVRVWCVKFPFLFQVKSIKRQSVKYQKYYNTRNSTNNPWQRAYIYKHLIYMKNNAIYYWVLLSSLYRSSTVRFVVFKCSSRLRYPAFSISYETFSCRTRTSVWHVQNRYPLYIKRDNKLD